MGDPGFGLSLMGGGLWAPQPGSPPWLFSRHPCPGGRVPPLPAPAARFPPQSQMGPERCPTAAPQLLSTKARELQLAGKEQGGFGQAGRCHPPHSCSGWGSELQAHMDGRLPVGMILPESASCASGRVRCIPLCFFSVTPSLRLPSFSRPLKGKGRPGPSEVEGWQEEGGLVPGRQALGLRV